MLYAVLIPALLPVILVFWFVNKKDKVEKEPKSLIFKAMLWGAILSIPCAGIESVMELILKAFFEEGTIKYAAMENIVGVALIEELSKYIVFMKIIWKNDNYDAVRKFVNTHKSDVLTPLPFNSGYFMSFNVKTGNAEDIRKKLLAEKGIGIIQIDSNTLRVAFSSIDEEKIEEVYESIYNVAGAM